MSRPAFSLFASGGGFLYFRATSKSKRWVAFEGALLYEKVMGLYNFPCVLVRVHYVYYNGYILEKAKHREREILESGVMGPRKRTEKC